jgi:hypothetical protein
MGHRFAFTLDSLRSGLLDGSIELEPDSWRLPEEIERQLSWLISTVSRIDGPKVALLRPRMPYFVNALRRLMRDEPNITIIRRLSSMVSIVESAVGPNVSLPELESAAWSLGRHEADFRSATLAVYQDSPPETRQQVARLFSLCNCMKEAVQLKLAFEARGFLWDIGLTSVSLLQGQDDIVLRLFDTLVPLAVNEANKAVPYTSPYVPSQTDVDFVLDLEHLAPDAIRAALGLERVRRSAFMAVADTALRAHSARTGALAAIQPEPRYRL